MNLYYAPKRDDLSIQFEDVMSPCHSGTPSWWRKLDFYRNKSKSVLDMWTKLSQEEKQEVEGFTTVRACPGFRELFKNSYLLKFPSDLLLETTADGEFTWKTPGEEGLLRVYFHTPDQIGSQISDNYTIIKFILPFLIAGKGTKALFLDPIYYKDQPFKISPGVMELKGNNIGMPFNVIVFFEKKDATYHFQKGEPICIVYFSDRVHAKESSKIRRYDKKKFFLDYEDV